MNNQLLNARMLFLSHVQDNMDLHCAWMTETREQAESTAMLETNRLCVVFFVATCLKLKKGRGKTAPCNGISNLFCTINKLSGQNKLKLPISNKVLEPVSSFLR
jgi:hypothetical protein